MLLDSSLSHVATKTQIICAHVIIKPATNVLVLFKIIFKINMTFILNLIFFSFFIV